MAIENETRQSSRIAKYTHLFKTRHSLFKIFLRRDSLNLVSSATPSPII